MDLESIISSKLNNLGTLNIIIAGMTCSGKTFLSNKIKEQFPKITTIFPQDYYFKDLKDVPRTKNGYLLDSINAFSVEEFINDAWLLLSDNHVFLPNYDIRNNKRKGKNILIEKGKINIFEGLHTINLLTNLRGSLKIYVNSPLDICLDRRINRDCSLYKVTEEQVKNNFYSCIIPISKNYITPQIEMADIVVDERGKVLCL